MQAVSIGGGVMSHHRTIFMMVDGAVVDIGHVRITNDNEILSIWIPHMTKLFLPEVTE